MLEGTMIQAIWQNAKRILTNQNRVQNSVGVQGDRVSADVEVQGNRIVIQITDKFSITPRTRRLAIEEAAAASEATGLGHGRALLDSALYLRGYGCDSIDNDNDQVVDDCGEDKVPATLQLPYGAACLEDFFLSAADLQACVERHLRAADDCHPVNTPAFEQLSGTCDAVYLDYSVNTSTCAAENHVKERFGPFRLDNSPPILAPLICPANAIPHTLKMIDIGPLGISTSDDCGIAGVTVKVLSDESSAAVNAKIYQVRTAMRRKGNAHKAAGFGLKNKSSHLPYHLTHRRTAETTASSSAPSL